MHFTWTSVGKINLHDSVSIFDTLNHQIFELVDSTWGIVIPPELAQHWAESIDEEGKNKS